MRETCKFALVMTAVLPCTTVASEVLPHASYSLLQMAQGGANGIKASVQGFADSTVSSTLKNWLSNPQGVTEVSVTGITSDKPTWSILVTRPIYLSADKQGATFVQGSVFRQSDRTTVNLGYGYRKLVSDKKVLLGVNVFYDHEFPYDHQRMSIGGEIRTTVGEINANIYRALSSWRSTSTLLEERALDGHDLEAALALPYLPHAHIRAKTFKWNAVDGAKDIQGETYSLTGALGAGFGIEAGYTNYRDLRDERFFKVTYNIGASNKSSAKPVVLTEPYQLANMEERMYDKVRRENRIIKQTRSKEFEIVVTGY